MNKVILIVMAMLAITPLWFLATGSMLKASKMYLMPPHLIPANPSLSNYVWAFARPGIGTWAVNTAIVVGATAVASTLVSMSAGWAFSAYRFPGSSLIFAVLLAGLMVPRIALIIPLFVVTNKLGLSGQLASVIMPCIFSPSGMFLARKFFDSVPQSLIESARIDGASELQVIRYVVAPVSKPILAALALFASIGALQDWIWQALQLNTPNGLTLLVGWIRASMMRSTTDNDVNPMGHSLAVGVLLLVPLLVLFVVANKYFVGSLEGAEKG